MDTLLLFGRTSSHYTRAARMLALELDVAVQLVPIHELFSQDPASFGANPALKMPTLRHPGGVVFGTENICRKLASMSRIDTTIIWPEQIRSDLCANAQEMVWHAMAAQVQLILGTQVGKLPADSRYFAKARAGLEGSLRWLDHNLGACLEDLPTPRDTSLLEVTLYCLVEHLAFRETVALWPYPELERFADSRAQWPAALGTPYFMDTRPADR
jgi:glutathione S-transferase